MPIISHHQQDVTAIFRFTAAPNPEWTIPAQAGTHGSAALAKGNMDPGLSPGGEWMQ
jgi:hypothetical protein